MKRFVLAGVFLVLGFIILGVATSFVMRGPDKPATPPQSPAANADASRKHGVQSTSQAVNTRPLPSQNGAGQFGMPGGMGGNAGGMGGASGRMMPPAGGDLTQVPSTIIPLNAGVPPPAIHPSTDTAPQVPVLPQTDESMSHRGH